MNRGWKEFSRPRICFRSSVEPCRFDIAAPKSSPQQRHAAAYRDESGPEIDRCCVLHKSVCFITVRSCLADCLSPATSWSSRSLETTRSLHSQRSPVTTRAASSMTFGPRFARVGFSSIHQTASHCLIPMGSLSRTINSPGILGESCNRSTSQQIRFLNPVTDERERTPESDMRTDRRVWLPTQCKEVIRFQAPATLI